MFFKKYPSLSNIFCFDVLIIQLVLSSNNLIIYLISLYSSPQQGCTNSVCQVTLVIKFCTTVPNICGSSMRNLLHVTLTAPKILRLLLDFLKICATQVCSIKILCAHLSKISTLLLAVSIQKSTASQYWCHKTMYKCNLVNWCQLPKKLRCDIHNNSWSINYNSMYNNTHIQYILHSLIHQFGSVLNGFEHNPAGSGIHLMHQK